MKCFRQTSCLFLCSFVLLCSSRCIWAVTLEKTAKLVPPETILLADIDDFSKLKAQFEKTSFYKLYKDPAMAPFINEYKARWQEEKKKIEDEYFRIIADLDTLPQGRVAVAMVLNEQTIDANELPVLFISQWGRKIDKIKETMDKLVEKGIEDGMSRKVEDYRGVNITALIAESSEVHSFCFIDDCLIGSLNPDVLKFVIAHIKGAGSPTLADDDDYNVALRTVKHRDGPDRGQINLYVNIKQIIRTIIAEDNTGKAKTIVSNLGFDNVKSFDCSIDIAGEPGSSSSAKAILKIDGTKKGVCKILDVESAALRIPPFVPASVCSISFVNLNIGKAFDELANVLDAFSPQFAAVLYMPLLPESPQGEPPIHLKQDIIDYLGSQIVIAQSINKSPSDVSGRMQQAEQVPLVETLFAVAINNRSALERSLSQLHSKILAPGDPEARRQLLGHTIYLLDPKFFLPGFGPRPRTPMGRAAGGPASDVKTRMAFTFTDTYMLFSSEPVVERAVRALRSSETTSVASAKWFQKAKQNIPSSVGLAGLEDVSASAEYLWSNLRKLAQAKKSSEAKMDVKVKPDLGFPELMFSGDGSGMPDFTLLPEFDVVRKYLGLVASYGLSRPDGFFFESKYINPETAD
jgi:hypothetical protein